MKTLNRLILGIVTTLAALDAGADTNSPQTSLLKGTVVDAEGHALEGVTIESFGSPTRARIVLGEIEPRERVVATNGAFELQLPYEGSLIVACKPGLATAWRLFWGPADSEVRVTLGKPAVLAGLVVDEAGKPAADAEVSVSLATILIATGDGGRSMSYLPAKQARALFHARTSADGRFRIDSFPEEASANLEAKAPGKAFRDGRPDSRGPFGLLYRSGDEDIRLVLEPSGVIEGKIISDPPGQPLPRAEVSLTRDSPVLFGAASCEAVPARADGQFVILNVAPGIYHLHAAFGSNTVPDWVLR